MIRQPPTLMQCSWICRSHKHQNKLRILCSLLLACVEPCWAAGPADARLSWTAQSPAAPVPALPDCAGRQSAAAPACQQACVSSQQHHKAAAGVKMHSAMAALQEATW